MNIRQQKYKENRLKGMSAYRSAVNAGYAHNTAIAANRNIEKRINFDDLMRAYGLDDDTLLEVLKKGCTRIDKNGKPDMVAKCFIEIALKLSGKLKERHEHTGKDGAPIPTPIINIYGNKTTDNQYVHPAESVTGSRIAGQEG